MRNQPAICVVSIAISNRMRPHRALICPLIIAPNAMPIENTELIHALSSLVIGPVINGLSSLNSAGMLGPHQPNEMPNATTDRFTNRFYIQKFIYYFAQINNNSQICWLDADESMWLELRSDLYGTESYILSFASKQQKYRIVTANRGHILISNIPHINICFTNIPRITSPATYGKIRSSNAVVLFDDYRRHNKFRTRICIVSSHHYISM